jgi:hypothetical protein
MSAHLQLMEYVERGEQLQPYEIATLYWKHTPAAVFTAASELIQDGRSTEEALMPVLLSLVGFYTSTGKEREEIVAAISARLARTA